MAKFTPGPWLLSKSGLCIRASEKGWNIAEMNDKSPNFDNDARLIAAAPEMYEVLRLLMEPAIDHSERLAGCRQLASALLARIDGDSDD